MDRETEANEIAGAPDAPAPTSRVRRVGEGVVLGALIGLGLDKFGVATSGEHLLLACAIAGALFGLSRLGRRVLWGAGAAVTVLYLVIGYTPVMRPLMRGLERRDEPSAAPAVVVLGAMTHEDGSLSG